MLVRVKQFGIDNAGDLPLGVGATKFAAISALTDVSEAKSAAQQSGMSSKTRSWLRPDIWSIPTTLLCWPRPT